MKAPAPLFRDPIHDGAADPTIVYNRQEQAWWIAYTNRRANIDCPGVAWAHGTDIGIASSVDGATWCYRGIMEGLSIEPGRNSFWAPEILWHDGTYHMYVSYVRGVPRRWRDSPKRHILHHTSEDLWHWDYQSTLELSSNRVIDACVERMPAGRWRMWYKDEADESHTYAADSTDLCDWNMVGPVITDCQHEGPNVFVWKGSYWMITDPWEGLGVYRSNDAETWVRQENILRKHGERPDDQDIGRHADVLVSGDNAYIFYFTHPGGRPADVKNAVDDVVPYAHRRSSLQVAALRVEDGVLTCDRDAEFELRLDRPAD